MTVYAPSDLRASALGVLMPGFVGTDWLAVPNTMMLR